MRLNCGLMLMLVAALMSHCRSRPEASKTDTAATKASFINGRIAVFNIYDKATQLTRQAPGTMVSSRAALIPGLKSTETVSLADDKRKGEKYIPLNTANGSVVFVGLEPRLLAANSDSDATKADFNLLPATEKTLPPLSAQTLAPLEIQPRIVKRTNVILYNDIGWTRSIASLTEDGLLLLKDGGPGLTPYFHHEGKGILETLYASNFDESRILHELPHESAQEMLRKGGAIIDAEYALNSKWRAGPRETDNFWRPILDNAKKTGTVDLKVSTIDILAYIGEDPLYELKKNFWIKPEIKRKDLLTETISASINGAANKMNVPRDVELDILKYLDCNTK